MILRNGPRHMKVNTCTSLWKKSETTANKMKKVFEDWMLWLKECWGRHFSFFARIWLAPQFEDKASSSFFSREKWMQLDARLALLLSCPASLFTIYGHHLYNRWGIRKGETYKLSVIELIWRVSLSFVLFHVLQGKMGAPTPGSYTEFSQESGFLIMHLYICFF